MVGGAKLSKTDASTNANPHQTSCAGNFSSTVASSYLGGSAAAFSETSNGNSRTPAESARFS